MSHLRRARWGLEIGARAGKLYRCFPRSGVVAMNRAQSNEPDQSVSSTVSITVVSVTPARAEKLFAFASVEIDIDGVQIGVHGIRAMREEGGRRSSCPNLAMPAACGARRSPCRKKFTRRSP